MKHGKVFARVCAKIDKLLKGEWRDALIDRRHKGWHIGRRAPAFRDIAEECGYHVYAANLAGCMDGPRVLLIGDQHGYQDEAIAGIINKGMARGHVKANDVVLMEGQDGMVDYARSRRTGKGVEVSLVGKERLFLDDGFLKHVYDDLKSRRVTLEYNDDPDLIRQEVLSDKSDPIASTDFFYDTLLMRINKHMLPRILWYRHHNLVIQKTGFTELAIGTLQQELSQRSVAYLALAPQRLHQGREHEYLEQCRRELGNK